ncbi:putative peptidoglycan binding protein [Ulvibacter sp. MAR_2010_11]|uniref:peptidoglycan-binding protein n=1 Tax=Ulvibacter sp. MAR_2010_11 TaxID=1250229 RepID=UPI000C2B684F|nr:peptidoglycan-binding protein [Ulvibacter sp. MAR_2010_11]PKA84427.1 putative peptidoglycan binding protein [Ulvibacter sp. MAR_2010_11]
MKKNSYKKELSIKATQKRNGPDNNKKDIMKIQAWLSLYAIQNPSAGTSTAIDGDFGPATEKAVRNFQEAMSLPVSGVVTQNLFVHLCAPMTDAFEKPLISTELRELVVEAAENHLANYAYELQIKGASNSGPWVRAYMDGNEGSVWYWCMGFVQTIIDQAASAQGKNFKTLFPLTYSCDTVGTVGLEKGLLTRYQKIRATPSIIKPGDIFLLQKSTLDWIHTGIITAVRNDVIETIEGNTNLAGSRNGIAVMKRTRNFQQSKLDVFSIEPLV